MPIHNLVDYAIFFLGLLLFVKIQSRTSVLEITSATSEIFSPNFSVSYSRNAINSNTRGQHKLVQKSALGHGVLVLILEVLNVLKAYKSLKPLRDTNGRKLCLFYSWQLRKRHFWRASLFIFGRLYFVRALVQLQS